MTTTPSEVTLGTAVEVTAYPTHTWNYDSAAGRLTGRIDQLPAMVQAVEIMLSVTRFHWQIYTPNFGSIFDDLPGEEFSFVASEIERRAKDALCTDDRILSVSNFKFTHEDDRMLAKFTVATVYGSFESEVVL